MEKPHKQGLDQCFARKYKLGQQTYFGFETEKVFQTERMACVIVCVGQADSVICPRRCNPLYDWTLVSLETIDRGDRT